METQVFRPFRLMGIIINAVPLQSYVTAKKNYLLAAVGRSFYLYDAEDLKTKFISKQHPNDIQYVCCGESIIYTASEKTIFAWKDGNLIGTGKGHQMPIKQIIILGQTVITLADDFTIRIWPEHLGSIHHTIQLPSNIRPTFMVHPSTYVNKILVGFENGHAEIWNIKTQSKVYSFKSWESEITCMEQTPALDVIAFGFTDGSIILHNIRYDQAVSRFNQVEKSVTSISFCKDMPLMATGTVSGHVNIWDLEKRILFTHISHAHDSVILTAMFAYTHRTLITSGSDNKITLWKFEGESEDARVLRKRSGHHAPPSLVRFYDDGRTLISTGSDFTLRSSFITKETSIEFEQETKSRKRKAAGSKVSRLPLITDIAWSTNREFDWESVITCHDRTQGAYLWEHGNRILSDTVFKPKAQQSFVTAVAMSLCGNFCFIGTNTGTIDKFNLQSKEYRGSLTDGESSVAHSGTITGIKSDIINSNIITTSTDGDLKFWNFKTLALEHTIYLNAPLRKLALHKDTGFIAVCGDDFIIRIFDLENRNLIRQFKGHTNKINDMTFSHDAKLLVSCSNDTTIRVWDIPTGKMIDCFMTSEIATSVSFSNQSEFLASTHTSNLGIYIWSNKLQLRTGILKSIDPENLLTFDLENFGDDVTGNRESVGHDTIIETDASSVVSPTLEQLSKDLVTESTLPGTTWKVISNIEAIKERNKPKEAPKKPKLAPFFLSALLEPAAGKSNPFAVPQTLNGGSRIIESKFTGFAVKPRCKLSTELEKGTKTGDYTDAIEYLKSLSPSAVELEIQELDPATDDLKWTIDMLRFGLASNRNFEILQAYINLVITIHREVMASNKDHQSDLQKLLAEIKRCGDKLQDMFQNCTCLLTYFSDMQ